MFIYLCIYIYIYIFTNSRVIRIPSSLQQLRKSLLLDIVHSHQHRQWHFYRFAISSLPVLSTFAFGLSVGSLLFTLFLTVGFHNFKSQNFKLSVSNPKNKYVTYVSVLSQISNCQGLGRKNKHDNLKTDRRGQYLRRVVWGGCFRSLGRQSSLHSCPYLSAALPLVNRFALWFKILRTWSPCDP